MTAPPPPPLTSTRDWPRIIAIGLAIAVAGFFALVILSLLAITFLGQKAEDRFSSVGPEIGAPAASSAAPPSVLG